MGKILDLKGRVFNKLTVIELSGRNKHGQKMWLCKCDCGNKLKVRSDSLTSGNTQSCGCLNNKVRRIDLTGKKFNKLIFERYIGKDKHRNAIWLCKCECGNRIKVIGRNVTNGNTKSCGCYNRSTESKFIGENHPNWKGGVSFEPYCEQWSDKEYKQSIMERDGYICLNPECSKIDDVLSIHHIDYNKKNCHPLNLITVCRSCNSKANTNRKWHESWYQVIIDRRYVDHKG